MKALLLAVGLLILGAALAVATWLLAPGPFARGWLAALFVLLGWPLGSMALLLIHALTGGRWGEAIRLPLLLGTLLLPLAILAAIPVYLFLPTLYPWAHADVAHALYNSWYLNTPFLLGRAAAYALIWLVLAVLTLLGAIGGRPALSRIAPPGLILLAFTVTFASIDLTASLDPKFSSSVYGMLTGTGMTLFALSIAVLVAVPGAEGSGRDQLGKLLLALCVLWTYLDFVQLLVVWNSNLDSDAPWFADRFAGFWGWTLGVGAVIHGLGALLLLGIPQIRRIDAAVLGFAGLLVVLAIFRSWWLVLPGARAAPGLVDLATLVGLAAFACGLLMLLARLPALRERAHNV